MNEAISMHASTLSLTVTLLLPSGVNYWAHKVKLCWRIWCLFLFVWLHQLKIITQPQPRQPGEYQNYSIHAHSRPSQMASSAIGADWQSLIVIELTIFYLHSVLESAGGWPQVGRSRCRRRYGRWQFQATGRPGALFHLQNLRGPDKLMMAPVFMRRSNFWGTTVFQWLNVMRACFPIRCRSVLIS